MSVFFKNIAVPANGAPALNLAFPEPVATAGVVLAGFDVRFDDKEHFVHKLNVAVSATASGSSNLLISGTAVIQDKDPEHYSTGAVNGMAYGVTEGDTSLHRVESIWYGSGRSGARVQYLTQPISQAVVFLRTITLETKDTDFEVTSLTIDAGNANLEIGPYEEDSMGFFQQFVYFEPQLKLQKRDGKDVAVKTAQLEWTVLAIC